jgi:hypothetical protein
MTFTTEQLCTSTAEDELNYFTDAPAVHAMYPDPATVMPAGLYRVIDGQLFRIVSGVPPALGE